MWQKGILNKYLEKLPKNISEKYRLFCELFGNSEKQANILEAKEEQYQEGFLRELFCRVLGYTINPDPGYNIITEQKNSHDARKADGVIKIAGKVRAVIELKGASVSDFNKVEDQAFGYKAHHPTASYVIISNFQKLRFYVEDAADFQEFNLFNLSEEDFRLLYLCLSLEAINADIPLKLKHESLSSELAITNEFYKHYATFKRELFADIAAKNSSFDKLTLFKKTQKLLDRLLFIFFCEDRGLLPTNSTATIIKQFDELKALDAYQPLYARFKNYFNRINSGYKSKEDPSYVIFPYNGGLFKPDEILDALTIDDELLRKHALIISEYDFASDISVDILGHIFEHSLTEIDEIKAELTNSTAQVNKPDTDKGKRKKDGVFYTPAYITKYIVENTVGALCNQKKEKLGIEAEADLSDLRKGTKTNKATKQQAYVDKLQEYRAFLLSLKICDPACGSGAFLNAALSYLVQEHALIDELTAKVYGDDIVFQEVENDILENNLYGVDINEESVDIAKLSLWLHTARPGRKLTSLNNNIKCGNSLIDDPAVGGQLAFNWVKEFPEVFAMGGFDVIIGNPPYVPSRSITESEKRFYYNNFKTAEYQINTYALFVEKLFKLLKTNGLYGYIIPNYWLATKFDKNLRRLVFIEHQSSSVLNTYNVFEDAVVDTVIIVGENSPVKRTTYLQSIDRNCKTITERLYKISNKEWFFKKERIFSVDEDDIQVSFSKQIEIKTKKKLGDYFAMYQGMKPYGLGKGTPPQTSEMMKARIYNSETKIDESYLPLIGASNVQRYFIRPNKEFIKYGSNLSEPRKFEIYNGARILANRILSKKCLDCCYLEETLINNSDVFNLIPKEYCPIKALFVIMASSFCAFYLKSKNVNLDRAVFPKINVNTLEGFPVPNMTDEVKIRLSSLADKMLDLNASLQKKCSRFLGRLKETYALQNTSPKLNSFYDLTFSELVKELAKQKVKLTLLQKDELEDYFTSYQADIKALNEQIAATDAEINSLVYALYGLSAQEIKAVEGH